MQTIEDNKRNFSQGIQVINNRDDSKPLENEIRIRTDGSSGVYVKRAGELFLRADNPFQSVTISAIGKAIPVALAVSEKIREKIADLHAIHSIQTIEKTVERNVNNQQGQEPVLETDTRYSAALRIILTKIPTEDQRKLPGYNIPKQGVVTATLEEFKAIRTSRRPGQYNNNRSVQNQQYRGNYPQGGRPYNNDSRGGQSRGGYNNINYRDGRTGQSQRRGAPRQEKRYDGPSQNRN